MFEKVINPVVKNLKRLGIKANLRVVDPAQYQSRRNDYDYDICYVGGPNRVVREEKGCMLLTDPRKEDKEFIELEFTALQHAKNTGLLFNTTKPRQTDITFQAMSVLIASDRLYTSCSIFL